jgi:hypothetical protein
MGNGVRQRGPERAELSGNGAERTANKDALKTILVKERQDRE